MIKKVLLLLMCFTFLCLKAQSNEEAIEFLKLNCYTWACDKNAIGTDKQRLEISLVENDKYLLLRVNLPNSEGYYVSHINLSAVKNVHLDGNGSSCIGIIIETKPNGIEMDYFNSDGVLLKSKESWGVYFNKNGWADDSIRIKMSADNLNGPSRIVKALKYLAQQNGAIITESHF
jgi:hypothetical protein